MDRINKKLWILFQFSLGPLAPIIGTKFTISCESGPLKVKLWYHMLSFQGPIDELSLQLHVAVWRDLQIFWTILLNFSIFLVKYYTNLIYVKEKSPCLIEYFLLWVLETIWTLKFSNVLFLRKNSHWPCLYILSSKGTSQLEVPHVRTLGNIHGNFLNETLFYYFTNKSPTISFLEI